MKEWQGFQRSERKFIQQIIFLSDIKLLAEYDSVIKQVLKLSYILKYFSSGVQNKIT